MDSKRSKIYGIVVGAHTVLRDLGHPAHWATDERKTKFRKLLRPGAEELDISGIRGCPGYEGYLEYLKYSALNPLGADTGLVKTKVNEGIKAMVAAEVGLEISKYEALLADLESSKEAVAAYIGHLNWWLDFLRSSIDPNPEGQPIEELQELSMLGNTKAQQNILLTQKLIAEYSELFANLKEKNHGITPGN